MHTDLFKVAGTAAYVCWLWLEVDPVAVLGTTSEAVLVTTLGVATVAHQSPDGGPDPKPLLGSHMLAQLLTISC